jgi:hypothetical protein
MSPTSGFKLSQPAAGCDSVGAVVR